MGRFPVALAVIDELDATRRPFPCVLSIALSDIFMLFMLVSCSPGVLLQVALSPPVSRDNVALACVAGALGRLQGTNFDGADEINAAASKA